MTFNRRFVQLSFGMVVFGLALLLFIIGSALFMADRSNRSFDSLVDELAIRNAASDLFSMMQDAETGQRGYILTLNPDFLKPYHDAVSRIPVAEDKLQQLLNNHPAYESDMRPIYEMIDSKLQEMAQTVELAGKGQIAEANDIIQRGFGQNLMSNIRQRMQAIIDIADNNVNRNIARQVESSAHLKWVIVGAGVAIVIVLGGAIFVIQRHVMSLSAARRQVIELNADLEERVAERTEDLLRANQEIQRFAYIVTHDLRAPLVNIMGFTSELEMSLERLKTYVLADGKPLSEQDITDAREAAATDVPEALEFIRSSTSKMDGLINAILKISRDGRRQLKPERFDVRDVAEISANSLQHRIAEGDGEIDIVVPAMQVNSDRLSLDQIFTNIIDNAIKYRNLDVPLRIVVDGARTGRFVQIEFNDNGRGIAPEDQERVFELFRRAGQQNQKGDGIGLAHVRSLARNLGGDVTVRSKVGEGSTFVVRIPADLAEFLKRV
ncbi:CHASE3 domain-containing protein [Rhizobium sp. L1K21]|uniref:sensor histidine kinase n=1 Tax=Rhizobium sp. L1K21 TaxID=2954933 RepID=UPI00209244E0|nr:CHASE3 domain-containing protein [Rhizobium sp. L1K21]MCO6184680.1 CHASE3 domain-containing protein [Rhizobium sp. L1K21]